MHFLVSLPTLSNQDKELRKEAVLPAQNKDHKDPPVCLPTVAPLRRRREEGSGR